MKKTCDYLYPVICISLAVILIIFPEDSKNEAYTAICMCAKSVIPVLFPFSVLSSCLIASPTFVKILGKTKIARIFGLSDSCSPAVFFGWLFGFPIGAKTAVELYKNGNITKREAEKLIAVSNNSGPAFIVSVIGSGFFKSRKFGIYLYLLQVICGIVSGIVVTRLIYRDKCKYTENFLLSRKPFTQVFTSSVINGAECMINISGFIILFSVLTSIVKKLFGNGNTFLLISSFLELTNGSKTCAMSGNTVLCAFAVGFSGFSVISQVMSFAVPEGLSCKNLIITKLLQGSLCAAVTYIFYRSATVTEVSVFDVSSVYSFLSAVLVLVFSIKFIIHRKNT